MTSPEERACARVMSDVWELCAALWGDVPQLAEEEINILMVLTSEIKGSVAIEESNLEYAVQALHSGFELEKHSDLLQ